MRRQKGVAVITALLLTTLAITIVASLFWQQQVQVRSIENQRLQLQKQWILRGALDWAGLILRADGQFTTVDSLDEPWAVPLSETRLDQYMENGQADADASDATLSGGVEDAQGRFNLTGLVSGGNVDQKELVVFQRLLSNLQLSPDLAAKIAQTMAQAQTRSPGSGGQGSEGGASGVPQGANPSVLPFAYVDDLLTVPGFDADMLAKLRNFVIFLPVAGIDINANTAPAEVLAAKVEGMSLADAKAFTASKQGARFLNPANLETWLNNRNELGTSKLIISSEYFLINGNVKMSRAGLTVQALVERKKNSKRLPKLLWIREN